MAIYNLGVLEQPKQEVNPYAEMILKAGLQYAAGSALGAQEIAGKKEIATAAGEAEAKTLLIKREWEKEDMTRKNVQATWQAWSDKPKSERDMFPTTPEGKEYFKFAKQYVPETLFDRVGSPIPLPSTKDTIKQEVDSRIAEAKNILIQRGPDALTPGQTAAVQMEGFKDEVADVTATLSRNPEYLYMLEENPQKAQKIAQEALKQRINLRKSARGEGTSINELSTALGGGQPLFYGPNARFPGAFPEENRTPVSSQATPRATRFKVKRLP